MNMDIDEFTRERSTFSSKTSSRNAFIVSNALSIPYYLRMKINNVLLDKITVEPIDSS